MYFTVRLYAEVAISTEPDATPPVVQMIKIMCILIIGTIAVYQSEYSKVHT